MPKSFLNENTLLNSVPLYERSMKGNDGFKFNEIETIISPPSPLQWEEAEKA